MKISKETFTILRNFAAINESILLMPGSEIRTAVGGNVKDFYAIATVSEEFPVKCAIFNLKKFRECAGIFVEPEFEFGDSHVKISDGKAMFNYNYCDQHIIDAPDYSKRLVLKDVIARFDLKYSHIKQAIDAANICSLENIMISSDAGKITMKAYDEKSKSSDTFSITVAEDIECPNFESLYGIDKLRKLLDADYQVSINRNVLTELKSPLVTYFVGGNITVSE